MTGHATPTTMAPPASAGFAVNDLPISRAHVYNLIREGKLTAKKVGRRTVVTNWLSYLAEQPSLNKAA